MDFECLAVSVLRALGVPLLRHLESGPSRFVHTITLFKRLAAAGCDPYDCMNEADSPTHRRLVILIANEMRVRLHKESLP